MTSAARENSINGDPFPEIGWIDDIYLNSGSMSSRECTFCTSSAFVTERFLPFSLQFWNSKSPTRGSSGLRVHGTSEADMKVLKSAAVIWILLTGAAMAQYRPTPGADARWKIVRAQY